MSNNTNCHQITPGMCPPEGCPPPDRIECIIIPKVYDSCFQTVELNRTFTIPICCTVNNSNMVLIPEAQTAIPPSEKISPILECGGKVRDNGNGTYTAFWGYLNRNNVTVNIPQSDSFFTGNPIGGTTTPPTTFLPGRQECAFQTTFTGNNLVWTLKSPNGQTATATAGANNAQFSFNGPFELGDLIPCQLDTEIGISCTEISRQSIDEGFFNITLLVSVPLILTNPNNPMEIVKRTFTFTRTVTLCCPEGVMPDCSNSTIVNCSCFVSSLGNSPPIEVDCQISVCLVIACVQKVQLLVPSYGFCVPAPCVALPGVCPPTPPAQCF